MRNHAVERRFEPKKGEKTGVVKLQKKKKKTVANNFLYKWTPNNNFPPQVTPKYTEYLSPLPKKKKNMQKFF